MRDLAIAMILGMVVLAGCQRQAPATASGAGCTANALSQWEVGASQIYQISAASAGPDCAKAVITLVVRGPEGAPLFVTALAAGDGNLAFADVKDGPDMQARLTSWIEPAQASLTTTADLPLWPEGADGPLAKPVEGISGTFPFVPDGETYAARATYEALRSAKSPVFCYVQGTESYACLTAQDGAVFSIGLQVFPG